MFGKLFIGFSLLETIANLGLSILLPLQILWGAVQLPVSTTAVVHETVPQIHLFKNGSMSNECREFQSFAKSNKEWKWLDVFYKIIWWWNDCHSGMGMKWKFGIHPKISFFSLNTLVFLMF